jgi:hypothetical protein
MTSPTDPEQLAAAIAKAIAKELRIISLLGKDNLTESEALFCACVSRSQFLKHAKEHNIHPYKWMGRLCYRKADIIKAMDQQWQRYNGALTTPASRAGGYSNGRTRKARTASPSATSTSSASAAPATSSAPNS